MTAVQPIIDAHHHIWRFQHTPWLNGPPVPRIFGEYGPLRRDYGIEEYREEASRSGVSQSVYIQVNVAPGQEVEEVRWVSDEGRRVGLISAIVSFADLGSADLVRTLEQQQQFGELRGVRQQLHWHSNPVYRFAKAPDLMLDPGWMRGLKEVQARGLVFELQVFPGQFEHAIRLIDAFPDQTFVLLHAGMLEDRSPEGVDYWRAGLRRMAERPNVLTKLSGLGTFVRACSVELWQPVIEQAVDAFGPKRCMWGSNFPIEKLWTSYEELVSVVRACLSLYAQDEQRLILHDVAKRTYRI